MKNDGLALALDGPLNGQYIDAVTAFSYGYFEDWWPTGEVVWSHNERIDTDEQEPLGNA